MGSTKINYFKRSEKCVRGNQTSSVSINTSLPTSCSMTGQYFIHNSKCYLYEMRFTDMKNKHMTELFSVDNEIKICNWILNLN